MKQAYKVQNRTLNSRRVKLTKNGGSISFENAPIDSFVENSRELGFCLTANTQIPPPLREGATKDIELSAHPMGIDGRVSLYTNGELTKSLRYGNLKRVTGPRGEV